MYTDDDSVKSNVATCSGLIQHVFISNQLCGVGDKGAPAIFFCFDTLIFCCVPVYDKQGTILLNFSFYFIDDIMYFLVYYGFHLLNNSNECEVIQRPRQLIISNQLRGVGGNLRRRRRWRRRRRRRRRRGQLWP